jgi:hypothetical protein
MKFTPQSEEEILRSFLLPDGNYNYEVVKSEDKVSSKGNEYLALELKVWDQSGREHFIYTNLAFVKLLKHFCDLNGLTDSYINGELQASQCLGKSGGKVMLGFEDEKPNPKGGMYKAKNIVVDYVDGIVLKSGIAAPHVAKPNADGSFIDDDIPF